MQHGNLPVSSPGFRSASAWRPSSPARRMPAAPVPLPAPPARRELSVVLRAGAASARPTRTRPGRGA